MRNIFKLFMFAMMMVIAFVAMPKPSMAIDTGNQVTYCVDQVSNLPVIPAPAICLENPPDLMYVCGVDVESTTVKTSIKDVWAWCNLNLWWIASILLVISEGLGLTDKIESNGILHFIFNWLKKKSVKPS